MTIPYLTYRSPIINTPFFEMSVIYKERETYLLMKCQQILHTSSLPATTAVLKRELPTIFHSLCFNSSNFSFTEEVKDTEIAHLFEHICLEYLCRLEMKKGGENVEYLGETKWNWKVDKRGTFHISISAGLSESHAFKKALEKAIELINKIIEESQKGQGREGKPQPVYVNN